MTRTGVPKGCRNPAVKALLFRASPAREYAERTDVGVAELQEKMGIPASACGIAPQYRMEHLWHVPVSRSWRHLQSLGPTAALHTRTPSRRDSCHLNHSLSRLCHDRLTPHSPSPGMILPTLSMGGDSNQRPEEVDRGADDRGASRCRRCCSRRQRVRARQFGEHRIVPSCS